MKAHGKEVTGHPTRGLPLNHREVLRCLFVGHAHSNQPVQLLCFP